MLKRLASKTHPQFIHGSKITLPLASRHMRLGKEDFTRRPVLPPPEFQTALSGAQLSGLKALGVGAAQVFKNRHRFQTRVAFQ
jgi:hypothetical protein